MFKKGQSGNPKGKKPGTKDKKWATLQYWYERLEETLSKEKMPIAVRAQIEYNMIVVILGRKPLPPDSPEESVKNALLAQENLRKLEEDARRGAKATGD